jgi:hypothetical protein
MGMQIENFKSKFGISEDQCRYIHAFHINQMYTDIEKTLLDLQMSSTCNSTISVCMIMLGHGNSSGYCIETGVRYFEGGPIISASENLDNFINTINTLSADYSNIVSLRILFTQCHSHCYKYTNSPCKKLGVHHHQSITDRNPYSKNHYVCNLWLDIIDCTFPLLIDLYSDIINLNIIEKPIK